VKGPARFAPVLIIALAAGIAPAAFAQSPAPQRPPAAQRPTASQTIPTPDRNTQLKLIWTIMSAIDQANRTGNYSVLRDLSTAKFQADANQAALGAAFAPLRAQPIDVADSFLLAPVLDAQSGMTAPTAIRLKGHFPMRPLGLSFDMIFEWERGAWRLSGLAVEGRPG